MKKIYIFLIMNLLCFAILMTYSNATAINQQTKCIDENIGVIDIVGVQGKIGEAIWIPINLQGTPNLIHALGFEFIFDSTVLNFENFVRGNLTKSFDMFDINIDPLDNGRLIIAGFSSKNGIPKGSSGDLVWLKFTIINGATGECYPLGLQNLEDHLANITSSKGYVLIETDEKSIISGDSSNESSINTSFPANTNSTPSEEDDKNEGDSNNGSGCYITTITLYSN